MNKESIVTNLLCSEYILIYDSLEHASYKCINATKVSFLPVFSWQFCISFLLPTNIMKAKVISIYKCCVYLNPIMSHFLAVQKL